MRVINSLKSDLTAFSYLTTLGEVRWEKMFINILILLLEILFCYIILIKVINNRHKLLLFIGIGFSIVISGLIFGNSIFRYFALPVLVYIILKLLYKETSISSFFIITLILFYKFLIEFCVVMLLYGKIDYIYIVFIFETILIITAIIFSKYINKINETISKLWNGIHEFYFRYLFLITFCSFILFTIYNLMKIKEVL